MKTKTEKRACDRNSFSAEVSFSFFNKEPSYFAQVMNLGAGGMCFNSGRLLKPGAMVCIYLEKILSESSDKDFGGGLRYVTLAEVKWCNEVPGEETPHYEVGVKYFGPAY